MRLAAESAQAFGDVVVEQVDSRVLVLTQVRRGQVGHTHCLLVVIRDVVHVQVRVRELFERSVVWENDDSLIIIIINSLIYIVYMFRGGM